MAINYFSAEKVEATARHDTRIRITNRATGNHFYRPWQPLERRSTHAHAKGEALEFQIRLTYISPDLELRVLWHDEKLEMTFFAVKFKGI
jgi:hypothetical protein